MAEGTRFKDLDSRLVSLEAKFIEFSKVSSKGRAEMTTQMGNMSQQIEDIGVGLSKVDGKFEELRQLIMGMQGRKESGSTHSQGENEGANGRRISEEVISSNPNTTYMPNLLTAPITSMLHPSQNWFTHPASHTLVASNPRQTPSPTPTNNGFVCPPHYSTVSTVLPLPSSVPTGMTGPFSHQMIIPPNMFAY